jgi:hypothetical protein
MIITRIIGGLGNQMFQYAAGRALSLERRQPLRLDITGYKGYKLHDGFELHRVFECPAAVAAAEEVHSILRWQSPVVIRRVLARPSMAFIRRDGLVVEPSFYYWPGIKNVPDDCYLSGYWQSERYFQEAASAIRTDFTFKLPLTGKDAGIADTIGQVSAVSIHVRRGDYVTDRKNVARYGICTTDYYLAAAHYISENVKEPFFFIFSDDIAWVKDHLKIDLPCQYVDHNHGDGSHNDMRLMSMCRHHIIANSTFSWWAAWLNPDPDKIVIAPKNWFIDKAHIDDLYPRSWIIV